MFLFFMVLVWNSWHCFSTFRAKMARDGLSKCMKAVIFSVWNVITYTTIWLFRVSSPVCQFINDVCCQNLTLRPLFDLQRGDHQKNYELFFGGGFIWQRGSLKSPCSKCNRQYMTVYHTDIYHIIYIYIKTAETQCWNMCVCVSLHACACVCKDCENLVLKYL